MHRNHQIINSIKKNIVKPPTWLGTKGGW
jgi:hypothetical protein